MREKNKEGEWVGRLSWPEREVEELESYALNFPDVRADVISSLQRNMRIYRSRSEVRIAQRLLEEIEALEMLEILAEEHKA